MIKEEKFNKYVFVFTIMLILLFIIGIASYSNSMNYYHNYDTIVIADYEGKILSEVPQHSDYYMLQGIAGLIASHIALIGLGYIILSKIK